MKSENTIHNIQTVRQADYDPVFLDCMLDLFLGFSNGEAGKYLYETKAEDVWNEIQKQESSCYVSHADNDLVLGAFAELTKFIPEGTNTIEFGPGSTESIKNKTLPLLRAIRPAKYHAIDFCHSFLDTAQALISNETDTNCTTQQADIFNMSTCSSFSAPSIGIMLGATLGNMPGSPNITDTRTALIHNLKSLSRATSNGWLLVSIDTNQNSDELKRLYGSKLHALGHKLPLHRMVEELPCEGFDPDAFKNTPEWHPEKMLVAQTLTSEKDQAFSLLERPLFLRKGDKLHIMNSYKFTPDFFESCCAQANLDVLHVWHHESPMKLYLLADRNNPLRQEMAAQAIA